MGAPQDFSPRILEVGCGTGRNLPGFLQKNSLVFAVDSDLDAVSTARSLLLGSGPEQVFFSAARMEALPFHDQVFSAVYCIDVLHWAAGLEPFRAMCQDAWRVLVPGGIFFVRLRMNSGASNLADSNWFLADDALIKTLAAEFKAEWVAPVETRLVSDLSQVTSPEETSFALRKPTSA